MTNAPAQPTSAPRRPGPLARLLRDAPHSSFSDAWHRLGPTTPALVPHARITRQRFGGRTVYIAEDPAGGQFYRLTESAYLFVALLDGSRTVDDAWEACLARLGDDAPTQRECVELLARLQLFGLLKGDLPLMADMVVRRQREAVARRRQRRWGGGFAPTVPVLNPEPMLRALEPLLRAVFSPLGLAAWLLLIAAGVYNLFANRAEWAGQLSGVLDPSNLAWLGVVFVVLRAVHEFGHAAACKAMGGRCTEIGALFMAYVFPFPYCDTSSAWRFPEVRKRVIVSAGGVLAESVPAALAAILWAHAEPGLVKTLAYNVVLISGVSSVIFNLNPLLRYDGYYILSDITGVANLAQRATESIKFLAERGAFGVKAARVPPVRTRREFVWLVAYAVLSWCYRVFVTVTIATVLIVDGRYLILGLIIAVVMLATTFVWPLARGAWYLAASPTLIGRRPRAWAVVGSTIAAAAIGLGLIPVPSPAYAPATIEPRTQDSLRAGTDGFIDSVLVEAGQPVNAGDAIVVLRNPEVTEQLGHARAAEARAAAELLAASVTTDADRLQKELRLSQARVALADLERQAVALTVRAAVTGRVIPPPGVGTRMRSMLDRFVTRGTSLGQVASTDDLVVRCSISDRAYAHVFRERIGSPTDALRAAVRVRGDAGRVVPARVERAGLLASRDPVNKAITTPMGGEVVIDPRDPKQSQTLLPQFAVELAPLQPVPTWQPGLRATVRFAAPPEPLAVQWYRLVRQYLSDRIES